LLKANIWRNADDEVNELAERINRKEVPKPATPTPAEHRLNRETPRENIDFQSQFGLIVPHGKRRRVEEEEIVRETEDKKENDGLSEEQRAVAALLEQAGGDFDLDRPNLDIAAIPLMAINKIPGIDGLVDETAKYRRDVSLRPDESTLEDYERIPIESFGRALLMGMGWTENDARFPKAHLPDARPHLAGLGANFVNVPLPGKSNGNSASALKEKVSEKRPREESNEISAKKSTEIVSGDHVRVIDGDYKGETGLIMSVHRDGQDIYFKIAISDTKVIKIWEDDVAVEIRNEKSWLQPHLRVKIIDKALGKHYKKKCVIQDIIAGGKCIVKTDDGRAVEGLRKHQLQTCVPSVNERVLVVLGEHRGEAGRVLEKNSEKDKVVVQIEHDMEARVFNFDDVCEFLE